MNKPDWTELERIEARIRDDKARLARLKSKNNALKVDLDRIVREASQSKDSPVWVEIIGGIIITLSIGVIFLGMMLL